MNGRIMAEIQARISVFSHNAKALLLYSSPGFIPYGMEEREAPAGERVALLYLAKTLLAADRAG
jgi:ribosomal protein S18 acetylase RimI-like enzyme